jgi:hypothetical protein
MDPPGLMPLSSEVRPMSTPSPRLARARRWAARAVAVLGLSALVADGGLRQDELDCEEAASYLESCCPDFTPTFACTYTSGCSENTAPALSISDSQCILAESCDQIVSSGLCTRVQNLPSPMGSSTEPTSTPVCP